MAGLTDVEIANLALNGLGQSPVTSFTEAGKAARLLSSFYEPTVKEVLRTHPWRCCRAIQILAADPTVPVFGFDYACALPSDFIQVVKVNDNLDKYQVMNGYLQIDDNAPELTYTARKTADAFDPGLVSVISARLEWRLAKPLTDSDTTAAAKKKDYQDILQEARFADALDGAPDDPPMGTWAEARLTGA